MNRAFRLIWSAARGACVVAPETARGRGSTISVAAGLCTTLALAGPANAQGPPATVIPVPGSASAHTAPNGVPVVNIGSPNGAGLSHNRYTRYDVDQRGLVLNNSLLPGPRQSQLAGGLMGNPNLGAEAKVILNEVVSASRSRLAGFTEVLGGKADVIVANPYGITCSGCGFINSDRITLATGTPAFGADGGLAGFNVSRGDVLVDGGGLNASAQQILDIVTRSARIDGQINTAATGSLGIVTGSNQWRYASRDIAGAATPDGATPALALDSSALGGMYAGRIRIIATEAGAGVRMLGDAAASVDDFHIDSAGRIALQGRASAARDLQVRQTADAGAASIALSGAGAALTSGRDLALSSAGGVTLGDGMLRAGAALSLQAQSLTDRSANNASRSAGTSLDAQIAGHADIDGSRWGAGGALALQAGSLSVGAAGASFASGEDGSAAARGMRIESAGDLSLAKATLVSGGDMALAAQGGALAIGAGVDAESAAGMALTARTALNNDGRLLSAGQMSVDATDPAAVAAVVNNGLMQAGTALAIGAGGLPVMLANTATGRMLAGNLAVTGVALDNASLMQASTGLAVRASGAVVNHAGGTLMSTGAGSAINLDAGSLDNAGTLQSAGDMTLNVAATLANAGTIETTAAADGGNDGRLAMRAADIGNSGTIASAGAAALSAAGRLANSGLLQAQAMTLDAGTAIVNQGAASRMLAGADLAIAGNGAAALDNAGILQAGGALRLGQDGSRLGDVRNAGGAQMLGNSVSAAARDIDNAGLVQANQGMDLQAGGRLDNRAGARLLQAGAQSAMTLQGADIANSGSMQSAGTLLARAATDLENFGLVQSAGTLTLDAGGVLRNFDSPMLSTAGDVAITASTLENTGRLQAQRGLAASIGGTLFNGGVILSDGTSGILKLRAGRLNNTGVIQADGAADIATTAGKLQNSRDIIAGATLDLAAAAGLENNGAASRLLAGGGLNIRGGADISNEGRIQAGAALGIGSQASRGGTLVNRAGGVMLGDSLALYAGSVSNSGSIAAQKAALIDAAALENLGQDAAIVAGSGRVSLAGGLRNEGVMHGADALEVQAASILNTGTAGMSSAGNLTLAARAGGIGNDGALYAGKTLSLAAGGQAVVNGDNASMDATDISLNAGSFSNSGMVEAKNNIAIRTTESFSNLPVGKVPEIVGNVSTSGDVTISAVVAPCLNYFSGCKPGTTTVTTVHQITETVTEALSAPLPSRKGQIVAGARLDIDYGRKGSNTAALLSAPTMKIHSSDKNPQAFVNQDLHLDQYQIFWRWKDVWTIDASGLVRTETHQYFYPTSAEDYKNADGSSFSGTSSAKGDALEKAYALTTAHSLLKAFDAGIFANTLVVSGGTLVNRGSPLMPTVAAIGGNLPARQAVVLQPGSDGTALDPVTGLKIRPVGPAASAQPFQGLNLALPSNPNGFFVLAKDPAARYLVETNPLFVNGGANGFPGSDYLAELLGYKPDEIQKRLGDASYEARLIRDQIVAQTGSTLLRQQVEETAQVRTLMEQGAGQSATLGLTFGRGLNPDQIARLEQDLVWMVEEDVGGTPVLVPVVYLARSTRQAIISGTVIEALDLQIRSAGLENAGGTIRGGKVDIATAGDVRNLSGVIEGRSVAVASGAGSVINQTDTDTSGKGNVSGTVGKRAVIASGENLTVAAAKDVVQGGATLAAGGDASVVAGGNVSVQSVSRLEASDAGGTAQIRKESQLGSTLAAGGALAVKSGADLTVSASSVTSGKDMSLEAGRDLRIVSAQEVTAARRTTTTTGAGVGGGVSGTSTTTTALVTAENAASSVSSGGKLDASAEGQLLVRGSSLKAQGDLQLEADTVRIEAGRRVDARVSRTDTSTYLKSSAEGKTGATANAKAASDSASETSDKRSTVVDGREAASKTTTATRSASGSSEAGTGKAVTPDPERKATDKDVSTSDKRQQRDAIVDDRGRRIVSAVDTNNTASSSRVDDGSSNMRASSSALGREDSVVTRGQLAGGAGGAGSTNSDLAAKGSAAASASAGASAEASGKAGLALVENTTVIDRSEQQQAVASEIASGGKLTIGGRRQVTLQGARVDAAGDAVLAGDNIEILAAQDTKTSSTTSSVTSAGFLIDSKNKAEAAASGKASAEGSGKLATGGSAGTTVPDKVAAGARGSAAASGDALAEASSKSNIDIVRDLQTSSTSKEVEHQGSAIRAGGDLRITAGNKLKAESADLQGDRQVELKARDMEFLATQDLKESSSSSTSTSGGLYVDGGAKAQAQGSAALKGEAGSSLGNHGLLNQDSAHAKASGSLDAKGSATADAKGGAGLQFRRETEEQQESAGTAKVTTIRSAAGDVSRSADNRIADVGTQIDAAGNFSQEAKTIDSQAASNTASSSSKTQSDSGKLGVYGRANAEASGSLSLSAGAGAGYTGNTLDKQKTKEAVLDANAQAGLEAEYAHKDSSKSASSSTAVVSSITAGGRLASKSGEATSLEGTRMEGREVDLQAGSLDMKAARNTSRSSEQETEGGGKLSLGANAGTGSPVTGALSGNFDRTTKSAEASDAVVGSIQAGENLSIRTRDDARLEGAGIKAGGNLGLDVGGKLDITAAQSTRSTSEETIHGALELSATKSDSGGSKGLALEGSYAKKTASGSKAAVADIAAGGDLALSTGGDARLEGTRLQAGGDADVDVKGNLKFDAARDISRSETLSAEGSLNLGATNEKSLEKGKQTNSSSFGFGLKGEYEKSDSDKAVTGGISAENDLRVRAGGDATLEGTDLRAGKQASVSADRDLRLQAATDSTETTKFSGEIALGAASNTVSTLGKDGSATPDNAARTRTGALDLSGDYEKSDSRRGATVQAGAGGATLAAGRDLGMQGGSVKSDGDVALTAGGNVNLDKATSTTNSIGGSLDAAQATTRNTVSTDKDESAGKKGAGIRGGINESHQGTAIVSGGQAVLKSGGATSMTNTETTAARGTVTQAGKGVTSATVKDRNDVLNLGASVKNSSKGAPLAKPAAPVWKPATPAKQPSWKPATPPGNGQAVQPAGAGKGPGSVIGTARATAKAATPTVSKAVTPAAKKPAKPQKPVIGQARKAPPRPATPPPSLP